MAKIGDLQKADIWIGRNEKNGLNWLKGNIPDYSFNFAYFEVITSAFSTRINTRKYSFIRKSKTI